MSPTELLHLLPLLLLGAVLGFSGGLFGIGGGIIAVPLLTLGFGLDQATAQGTALVLMVPNLVIAFWRYMRHNPVPFRDWAGIALAGIAFTWVGAQAAHRLDQSLLRALFGLLLILVAARGMGWGLPRRAHAPYPTRFFPLVGALGGLTLGLLGVGGGLIATPIFARQFGQGQRIGQSLGLALVTPGSVVALGTYAAHGSVDWRLGIVFALGGVFTVAAGVSLAHRLPERRMQRMFAAMTGATGLYLLVGGLLAA